jgi:hypothetical protein
MQFTLALLIFSAGIPFLACGDPGNARLPQRDSGVSCFDRVQKSDPPFLDSKISVTYKERKPSEVARDLRNTYNLPISYIVQPGDQAMSLSIKEAPVRSLLQSLITRMPGNICRVIAGHVVIYPDRPEFKALVQDVDIIDKPRAIAARRYVEIASEQVDYFKGVEILLGGNLASPMFEDQVSLSHKARVIDHLVQILGGNQSVFFVIDRAPVGGLYFSLGSV